MQLPLTDPDTLFEELLQDLPPETAQMAREFKAFVRAKKVKTPAQLLRVIFLYLLSAPLTILLIYCHIKSYRRVSPRNEAMAERRKEDRRADSPSHGF